MRFRNDEYSPLAFRREVPLLVEATVHMSVLMWLIVPASGDMKIVQHYRTLLNVCVKYCILRRTHNKLTE